MIRSHTVLEIPSNLVVDIALGEVFEIADGSRYILLARNPWKAKVSRFTWLDRKVVQFVEWVQSLRRK